MPKKRFSAFDDFPTEPSSRPDWKTEPSQNSQEGGPAAEISAPAAARTAEPSPQPLFDGIGSGREGGLDHASVLGLPEAAQVERIERLKPSQMLPDRFQPRRLLPTALRDALLYPAKSTATRPLTSGCSWQKTITACRARSTAC